MRGTKYLVASAMIAMATMFTMFTSCEKDPVEKAYKGEVEFTVVNPAGSADSETNLKQGIYTGLKDGTGPGIPVCSDEEPAYIMYWLTGETAGHQVSILQNYGNGELTAMEKLPAGSYTVERFEVYDSNDNKLWASPLEGSYYDNLFHFDHNVAFTFDVKPFEKSLTEVDVLCWQDYDFDNFGYNGFDLDKGIVKTICFFGDVCTKFYEDWHTDNSPYVEQEGVFHDFPAIFSVSIYDESGAMINDAEVNSNADWLGTGAPLCIEYLDKVGVDEEYTAEISLLLPDGSSAVVGSISFTDDDASVLALVGEDGVYDFLVGGSDCIEGNKFDANYALPWVPLPSTITFQPKVDARPVAYFGLKLESVDTEAGDFIAGETLKAWCGNDTLWIHWDDTYAANVYPYYAVPDTSLYASITDAQWNALNWLANNMPEATTSAEMDTIQKAIWYVLNQPDGENNALAQDAVSNAAGYIPPLGGYIVVLVDPYENINQTHPADSYVDYPEGPGIQLAIVRYDP